MIAGRSSEQIIKGTCISF